VKMFRSLLICAALLAACVGCQNTYKQNVTEVKPLPEPMTARTRVYIAMPEDALDKNETVPASGKRTTLALQTAFQRHTKNVIAAKVPETFNDALEHARELACDYVAFPMILEWKDRPTEWTGVRDRLKMQIEIVAVASREVALTSTIEGVSRWMTDGGDAPQDLMTDPVDKFVRSLFRVPLTPSALPR
jgi:hypothetical protein